MGDLKARLQNARSKLLRRGSEHSTHSSTGSDAGGGGGHRKPPSTKQLRTSNSLSKLSEANDHEQDHAASALSKSAVLPRPSSRRTEGSSSVSNLSSTSRDRRSNASTHSRPDIVHTVLPQVTLEQPTPIPVPVHPPDLSLNTPDPSRPDSAADSAPDADQHTELPSSRPNSKSTPLGITRRQSLVAPSNARVITTLLEPELSAAAGTAVPPASHRLSGPPVFNAGMLQRKIWVKRPNSSATQVQIREDDLVDDVRDMILKKYANSLGRSFDAPDVTLRIVSRDSTSKGGERTLGPEEDMCRTLDAYYPDGQAVSEALIIDVPQRRTPKPSPRLMHYPHYDDARPTETASEYFPPMLPLTNPSPVVLGGSTHDLRISQTHPPHSIAVLQTGQIAPLPSPGSVRRLHQHRPKNPRHNTASPTALTGTSIPVTAARPSQRPRHDSTASNETKHTIAINAPLPTPPAPADAVRQNSTPPTPRVASPRPTHKKPKKPRAVETPTLPAGMLDGSVPPINVLIVEDNIINLRVLGAFMQRLKVRWQRAMNGKEAVTKWRAGGFHLVLMDIQLPIMNGLQATTEIRRLERVNSIGVFSSGSSEAPQVKPGEEREMNEDDRLGDKSLFKSPVIIVALTASSLQSDRHEALAAGCNDFLTKPVNFVWLERKVKEWGCMQALIDFDGWRKWKDFAAASETTEGTTKLSTSYRSIASRSKTNSNANLSPTSVSNSANGKMGSTTANGITSEEKKNKRKSLGVVPPPSLPEEETPPAEEGGSQ